MSWYFDSVCVFSLLGPVYFAGLQAKRSDPTRETSHALERVATERIATDCPCTWFIRPGEQHQGLLVITSGIGMKRAHGSPIKEYESMQHRRLTHLFLKSTTCLVLVFSSQITLGSQWIFACLYIVLLGSPSAGAFAPADVNTLASTTTTTATGTKAQTNEV